MVADMANTPPTPGPFRVGHAHMRENTRPAAGQTVRVDSWSRKGGAMLRQTYVVPIEEAPLGTTGQLKCPGCGGLFVVGANRWLPPFQPDNPVTEDLEAEIRDLKEKIEYLEYELHQERANHQRGGDPW